MVFDDYSTYDWGFITIVVACVVFGLFKKCEDKPCRRSKGLLDYLFNDEE